MADGTTVSGDIVTFDDFGVKFRTPEGNYTDRLPWAKFSQEALKKLAENQKIQPLVEPFIEIPMSERPKKPEVKIQEVKRLALPPPQGLFGALVSSSVGLFALLLIYAANIYSGVGPRPDTNGVDAWVVDDVAPMGVNPRDLKLRGHAAS